MEKAVCYVRVSTQEQALQGVSLEAQEERLRAYCTLQNLEIVAFFREEGVSASKPLHTRPEGKKLIEIVSKKQAAHVIALKLDRLFRDAIDALTCTRDWDQRGVSLHLVDMGGQTVNTATAMGRFFFSTMASFAELERNLIAERTTLALAHKKNHGEAYGPTPMGYDRAGDMLEANAEELELVQEMRNRRESGESLRKIASWLNCSGAATKKGGRWHASTVAYVLQNSLYA